MREYKPLAISGNAAINEYSIHEQWPHERKSYSQFHRGILFGRSNSHSDRGRLFAAA